MENISPFVAFAGGLLSLLSPCILPMLPVYIGSLCGPEIFQSGASVRRLTIFLHSLSFVLGFSLVFIILGIGAGLVGQVISSRLLLVRWISGSLIILFGLFMLAAPKVSWLNYEKHLTSNRRVAGGHLRSFIIGVLFALAWTPCVGPVLAGILTLAFNSESAEQGGILLVFYSLGLGLPFLVIGLVFDAFLPWLKRINRYSAYIYMISGLLLISVGILILINKLSWFTY
jgi:cytochrome c-type biogenesis protein